MDDPAFTALLLCPMARGPSLLVVEHPITLAISTTAGEDVTAGEGSSTPLVAAHPATCSRAPRRSQQKGIVGEEADVTTGAKGSTTGSNRHLRRCRL
jgi:hypothetical protein